MYISRITINKENVLRGDLSSGYLIHQAVWRLFADHADRRRDFLYRIDAAGKLPLVYTVSERKPDRSNQTWCIESKPYMPQVKTGMRLGFMVRVNPTVTKDAKRHDVVMEARYKLRAAGLKNVPSRQELIADACGKWLDKRSEKNGFKVIHFRADGYQQVNFPKGTTGMNVSYSVVDLSGILEVTGLKAFLDMLFAGLGPAKGFGCGLMLVCKL